MKNLITLMMVVFCSGILSVLLGKELCWDLANYHFYISFAFLHDRANIDYWPTSYLHQYINPTIDLLTYFLITHFTPRMAEFMLGAIHGMNIYLIYLLIRECTDKKFIATILTFFGIYGPTVFPGIGSFQNDNLITVFVLSFILLFIISMKKYLTNHKIPHILLILAGTILGLGVGLKLTAGIFIISAILSSFILPIAMFDRIKLILIFSASFLLGVLTSAGYWMITMWQMHHNPFFPFLNHIFHSPDISAIDFRDQRFLPQTSMQTVFYPFYFSWDGRIADAPFRDVRFAIVYGLLVCLAIQRFIFKIKHTFSVIEYWLMSFFIISYIIWQAYFSIARYAATLEILAPLIIFLLIKKLNSKPLFRNTLLFIIFYLLFFTMQPIPMIRAPWYETDFFNVKLPEFISKINNATVLMAYPAYAMDLNPRPQQYLIPFFPVNWNFIGIPFLHEKYFLDEKLQKNILSKLKNKQHKIYLLTSDDNMPELYQAAKHFGLMKNGKCENIYSDRQKITHQQTLICPVTFVIKPGL